MILTDLAVAPGAFLGLAIHDNSADTRIEYFTWVMIRLAIGGREFPVFSDFAGVARDEALVAITEVMSGQREVTPKVWEQGVGRSLNMECADLWLVHDSRDSPTMSRYKLWAMPPLHGHSCWLYSRSGSIYIEVGPVYPHFFILEGHEPEGELEEFEVFMSRYPPIQRVQVDTNNILQWEVFWQSVLCNWTV